MIPVVTADQMQAVDRGASDPVEVLIERAGQAVARAALRLLGRSYGMRVVVVAGKGNNGADGRAAAARLAQRGVLVQVVDATAIGPGARLAPADLVIDAAYGTGFRGSYQAPDPGTAPVLAVDIPSGVAADTGQVIGGKAVRAVATVTFAALKPGLLLGEGPWRSGPVEVADIGLGPGVERVATAWLVTDADACWLPVRPRDAHKWQSAVTVVAGSPGMIGAPALVARAALRAGAGYVRLGVPGAPLESLPSEEAVGLALPATGWDRDAVEAASRCRSAVTGPGLGRSDAVGAAVRRVVAEVEVPLVVDADGINALGSVAALRDLTTQRQAPLVITPHDGEFAHLTGAPPGDDRLAAVRQVATHTGAVVLLKGSTTVVAAPDGTTLFAAAGSPRLATAGTGDVLSGVIGAFLARGVPVLRAAALAAHAHGRAAGRGRAVGLVAGDLPELVADWLSEAGSGPAPTGGAGRAAAPAGPTWRAPSGVAR